jgi:hypothetical protein
MQISKLCKDDQSAACNKKQDRAKANTNKVTKKKSKEANQTP